ncbi:MAG TPA: VOC family protein [Candidatus Kapabacteria bacterium]|nr:VOC family protein [Candidatus Kapabacteria bacterium]
MKVLQHYERVLRLFYDKEYDMTFDHIAVEYTDLQSEVDFYLRTFVNAELLYQDATWAFVKVGEVKIAFVSPTEHPPHIAFSVNSHDELVNIAEEYKKKIKVHRDRTESFYTSDPSGNAIEIIWYPTEP